MEERIKNAFQKALEVEDKEIKLTDQFRDYEEWDSLGQLSLIAILDEDFGVEIESDDFNEIITVGDLLKAVQKRS
ncbi:MAG: acyl carrier protein [Proteobacteria bacterium]|nr:acyl carrier protein [Pseudomonadota bacterium]